MIVIQQVENDTFKRDGSDLWIEKTINLTEALCGFEMVITHLDGRKLLVKTQPGEVIKPAAVKAIEGEGMPIHKRPFEKGRLFVKFTVEFPKSGSITPSQAAQLEKILAIPRQPVSYNAEDVEEVHLHDVDPMAEARRKDREHQREREEAYDEDDDQPRGASNCPMAAQ